MKTQFNYSFRKASKKDIPYLAKIIIEAEKSNSEKLSYSSLCNLSEQSVKELIIEMLKQEVDQCEFSVNSFIVVEFEGKPVGGFGGWIEGFEGALPSKILKSNLILSTFSRKSLKFLKERSHLLKDILIDRKPMTLQLEYLFLECSHRGRKITDQLIKLHITNALKKSSNLKKVHVQVYKNNIGAVKAYKKSGFKVLKLYKCNDNEILNYLPFKEKYLMQKKLKN